MSYSPCDAYVSTGALFLNQSVLDKGWTKMKVTLVSVVCLAADFSCLVLLASLEVKV